MTKKHVKLLRYKIIVVVVVDVSALPGEAGGVGVPHPQEDTGPRGPAEKVCRRAEVSQEWAQGGSNRMILATALFLTKKYFLTLQSVVIYKSLVHTVVCNFKNK